MGYFSHLKANWKVAFIVLRTSLNIFCMGCVQLLSGSIKIDPINK